MPALNRRPFRRAWTLLVAAALCFSALAEVMQRQPAAAQDDFLTDLLMNEEQERRVAEEQHPIVLEQFGGEYDDPELHNYVQSLANFLGKTSRRPDVEYRVTILNSPIVNAFALPAGYLYVTRGLLALADSEAELAGVLAHEIGHVTARHTAQRYSRAVVAEGIVGLLGVLTKGTQYEGMAQAALPAAVVALQGFSREHEHEADLLGVETMSRAGFDPYAMSSFLGKLERKTELDAALAGKKSGGDSFNLFATHPRTVDRVDRTIAEASGRDVYEPMTARNIYMEKIDGILYGDDPAQGFVRGRVFAHPGLDLRFEAPEGFQLLNGQKAVVGQDQNGVVMRFDVAPERPEIPPDRYIAEMWAKGQPLQGLQRLDINGFPGGTATLRLEQQSGPVDLRFVAIETAPRQVYRFLFAAPSPAPGYVPEAARETSYSFRRLTEAEKRELKPYRLVTHYVQSGETASGLAEQMPFDRMRLDRFLVLNGLGSGENLQTGELVKTIVED